MPGETNAGDDAVVMLASRLSADRHCSRSHACAALNFADDSCDEQSTLVGCGAPLFLDYFTFATQKHHPKDLAGMDFAEMQDKSCTCL
jgi:hypothetical protein